VDLQFDPYSPTGKPPLCFHRPPGTEYFRSLRSAVIGGLVQDGFSRAVNLPINRLGVRYIEMGTHQRPDHGCRRVANTSHIYRQPQA